MKFARTRYYPVDHGNKLIWLEATLRKGMAESAHPRCVGILGAELADNWTLYQAQGYQTQEPGHQERRGGRREGAGRPFVGIKTKRLKINQTVHDKLLTKVEQRQASSGKYISVQEYASGIVLNLPDWQEIVPHIQPWGEPWAWVSLTKASYDELGGLVKKIKPLRTDAYVNLSNVFCAIVLRDIH
jgi:hypothetical protein